MTKKFNITGTCIPKRHFMSDMSGKLDSIMEMISNGDYFTIHRPRQYGKTTVIYLLKQRLLNNPDYLVLNISFEGLDSTVFENHQRFVQILLNVFKQRLEFMQETELVDVIRDSKPIKDFAGLSEFITAFVRQAGRKIVLTIDEVDKSSNNQLFLDLLGMLRSKYLSRNEGEDYTFHTVILAGVHDIKTLKANIRPGDEQNYNSPWNIAVNFDVDLELNIDEIAAMLEQYKIKRHVKLDIAYYAQRLFYFTSGYPFLVSFLCKIIDEKVMPVKAQKEWHSQDLLQAMHIALNTPNTNFENLVKNLQNNPELYDFVFEIIINGRGFSYNRYNKIIQIGHMHGILKEENNKVKVHNRLYEQLIYDYMSSNLETSRPIHRSA